ncbi:hypothetical protein WBG78_03925 [Chryseolinea sp. T2]|uniref:hypothetical protein n=1 Tax=Chryseolinea sp. T2 TaxID=3129255 RepID=UPI00307829BB
MKNYHALTILLLLSISCSEKREASSLVLLETKDQPWTTFEGNMRSPEGEIMEVELSLQEASPGVNSHYRLKSMIVTDKYAWNTGSEGEYEVTPLGDNLFGITLLEAKTGRRISSNAFFKRNIDRMRNVPSVAPPMSTEDFYFITKGDGRLTLADDDFYRIAADDQFTLHKRSDLFTVEGYVTVEPDCKMEFFERNTFEKWHVSKLGLYNAIEENYVGLASEPWEGIYIRALAYSVPDSTDESGESHNLVMKKVIAMQKKH